MLAVSLIFGLLSLFVASESAVNVNLVSEYKYQDADFGYLVKRYLRRVLLPHVVGDDNDDDDHDEDDDDDVDKKLATATVYDNAFAPDDRHLRVASTSYFDSTVSKWTPEELSREPPDPDFWDIVVWIGTQIGRGVRTLFDGMCKLCRAIYAGILYGWQSEGPIVGMNGTETLPPTGA